mgnify:CR=1 FL=1
MNLTKVIEEISADDFEKLCALFLKEIVKCESVNATQKISFCPIELNLFEKTKFRIRPNLSIAMIAAFLHKT